MSDSANFVFDEFVDCIVETPWVFRLQSNTTYFVRICEFCKNPEALDFW